MNKIGILTKHILLFVAHVCVSYWIFLSQTFLLWYAARAVLSTYSATAGRQEWTLLKVSSTYLQLPLWIMLTTCFDL